jgi:hypothetical protein
MVVVMFLPLPMIVDSSDAAAICPTVNIRGDRTETLDEPYWSQLSFCAESLVPPRHFPATNMVVSRMVASTIAFFQNSTGGDDDPVNSAHSCELPHGHITHEVWCYRHARKCAYCSKVTGSFVISRSIVIVSPRSGVAPFRLERSALNKQKLHEP